MWSLDQDRLVESKGEGLREGERQIQRQRQLYFFKRLHFAKNHLNQKKKSSHWRCHFWVRLFLGKLVLCVTK